MAGSDAGDRRRDLRSFGRRRGRVPSARQQALLALLPRYAVPLDAPPTRALEDLFGRPLRETWLEIGFGGGEHLLAQAAAHPDVGFIGCEPYLDGVMKVLDGIESRKIDNVRLHADDARPLLNWLPARSIARTFILFPDPWPKARHRKRRLVATPLLATLARIMRAGAQLNIATDIGDYADTMQTAFRLAPDVWLAETPADWRLRPPDWPATRYEQKAVAAGRCSYYFRWRRL